MNRRRLVEANSFSHNTTMAFALQASLLVRHSSTTVADAFCATRLDGEWGHAFGTLPPGLARELKSGRQKAVNDLKRGLILDAARKVFEADGLDGASLRAIASAAGYTPAALYFQFESKEAIYAEVLRASLASLGETVGRAILRARSPADRTSSRFDGVLPLLCRQSERPRPWLLPVSRRHEASRSWQRA